MPTYEATQRFLRDFGSLTPKQKRAFLAAVQKFVHDLERRGTFRQGLRVRRVEGTAAIFEMTWAPDGRATFEYGPAQRESEPHVIWRRCGTHDVFRSP